jgi:hypothetical protein
MKVIKVTLIILVAASILAFVKSDVVFHIAKVLPFCSGNPIDWGYELGGLGILVLFFLGLRRLHRNRRRDD